MEKQYDKSYFTLVQDKENLVDKPLKTKQLTFFQDAMVRFTKNKYNLIATIILGILILLSIFVPILTPSSLLENNSTLKYLPPRVPVLENFGILDGYKNYQDQFVDLDTIDPETGLGYPSIGFDFDLIEEGSLENYYITGSEKLEQYVGGTVAISINTNRLAYSMYSPVYVYQAGDQIELDIDSFIGDGGTVKAYFSVSELGSDANYDWNNLVYLGETDSVGITTIDLAASDLTFGDTGYIVYKFELDERATDNYNQVVFNSISIMNNGNVIESYSGYELSQFGFFTVDSATEGGSVVRADAVALVASFSYNAYEHIFGDKLQTIGEEEYLEILENNPGMEDSIVGDPSVDDSWYFDGDWLITEVVSVERYSHPSLGTFNTYIVKMDGAKLLGMESTPYFLFGTDGLGRDVLTLVFLGLRTSLLLGLIAATVNITVGVIWGSTSAYYGGQTDILMERFKDVWGSFPQITMISILVVLFGRGFTTLFIFMVYDGWIPASSTTRLQFYRYKGREYVLAARTLGASDRRLIFKHILPNALGTIVTRSILSIPRVIFLETTLSFLNLGLGAGQEINIGPITLAGTSIGVILAEGRSQIVTGNYWLIIYPALIVSILMITFNMFGNALRDALNPQLRGAS